MQDKTRREVIRNVTDYVAQMWALAADGERQGVFFFIAMYTFAVGGYSLVRQLMARRWPSGQGELIDAGVKAVGGHERWRSDQDYKLGSTYRYVVDGRTHEGTRVSPWVVVASHNARFVLRRQLEQIQRDAEGRVTVFYDPKRPEKSFLVRPGLVGLAVTLVMTLLPLALFVRAYHL